MRALVHAALALGLLIVASPAAAQGRPEVISVLTATSEVRDVAHLGDRLLLATSGGLVVRTGDEVERVLTSADGLPGTRLHSVTVLGDEVWVGGVEGTAVLAATDLAVLRTVPLRRVRRVVRLADATFAATFGDGLFRLEDGAEGAPSPLSLGRSHARRRLTDLAVVGDELWASTAGAGLLRVGADGHLAGRLTAAQGLGDDHVWDLLVEGDRVLLATSSGVAVVRGGSVLRRAPETRAMGGLAIRDARALARVGGTLFVGTFGGGVARVRGATATLVEPDVSARRVALVHVVAEDAGAALVGHVGGLHRVGERGAPAPVATGGLPSADITSLARAFGRTWVGTFRDGLARIDARGRVEDVGRAESRWGLDGRVNDLAVTGRGADETLWIATDRGLYAHDGRRYVLVDDAQGPGRTHVTNLHVADDGALWVTSSRQLSRYARSAWRSWTGDPRFPVAQLHAVTTDRLGRVWVGSLHGLFRFDPEHGTFERHTVSSGELPVDWVTALARHGDGIVAGTYHGGLSWLEGARFRLERESDGLPAGWVNPHALREVGGAYFVGTLERGLLVGRRGAWTHLTVSDGLPSDDVTDVLPDGQGRVWVATRGGLARVRY